MWNKINTLRRVFRVSLIKTLVFNFWMLPFSQAIKLPIILTRNVHFYNLSGKVILKGPVNTGMVRFGFFGEDNMYWNSAKILLKIEGELVLYPKVNLASGIILRIEKGARLVLEENIRISNNVKIICYESIHIKKNCRIAWESQLIDTTFHFIRNKIDNTYSPLNNPIIIGENNWIGNRVTIMKGSETPNFCIVASGSLINKKLNFPTYCIVAGTPVKIVRENVYRVLDKEEQQLRNNYN